jgi:hypothetical protein
MNLDQESQVTSPKQVVCNNPGCWNTVATNPLFTRALSPYDTMEPGMEGDRDGSPESAELTTIDSHCRSNGIAAIALLEFETDRTTFVFFRGFPYTIYQTMPPTPVKMPMYATRFEKMQYRNFVALRDSVSQ